nr:MAG TPA: hypothetical protein [Caudoviricetes sp.]
MIIYCGINHINLYKNELRINVYDEVYKNTHFYIF